MQAFWQLHKLLRARYLNTVCIYEQRSHEQVRKMAGTPNVDPQLVREAMSCLMRETSLTLLITRDDVC